MTPAARVQAAIELLDAVIAAARDGGAAADTLIQRYFKDRRYAGSKDRRAVRDLVYRAIRRCGERPDSGRAAMAGLADDDGALAALFDGEGHGPARLTADEPRAPASAAPEWLLRHFDPLIGSDEQQALLGRAPLDLRVNRLKADMADVRAEFADAVTVTGLADCLRLETPVNVESSAAYRGGAIEVQDAGSQWLARACAAQGDERVIDLCAGAGGKTLALAATMENGGAILACDINRQRLAQLPPRAERAGATNIGALLLDPGQEAAALEPYAGEADLVLIDAPCSGTGTWRRNPEARWRLTPQRLARLVADQARLLDIAVPLVRPGGRIVYAVCALTKDEGRNQITAFLARHPGWRADDLSARVPVGRAAGDGRLLTPGHDATDGFFVACLRS